MTKFAIGLLAGLLLLTQSFPQTARADDAQALLAKHKAFVGWQFGDGSVQSLLLDRTYTDDGGKVTQHATERRLGLAYRRDYQSTKNYREGGSTGFTGSVFWTTSENGFTVPIVGDNAKYYLAIDAFFMEGTAVLPATLGGTATVAGKNAQILHVAMNGALPFDVYEDPESGAFLKVVIDPGGDNETAYVIHSYTDLGGGKKLVGSWSIGNDKGVYTYTKATLNASVAAAELHPPQPSATWSFANAQPFKIKVTDTRIYVDAKVNGVQGRFIMDTGAGSIALTDDFANRAHVKEVDKSTQFGIGGVSKSLVRKAETVDVGGNVLSNVVVNSFNQELKDRDETADGLMGFDLFAAAIVNVSLSDGTMQITDPSAGAASPGSNWYPLTPDLTQFVPRVPAKINDKFELMAILDTGGGSLVLFSPEVEHHGVNLIANRNGFLGANAVMGGVSGEEFTVCGPLAKIQIGPFPYSGTEACESPNWDLHEGLVGFDFLKHFDYVFDYPHGVMYMKPRP